MLDLSAIPWSSWSNLSEPQVTKAPRQPGLYRVRDAVTGEVLYVGETGAKSGLQGRLSQLRTCNRSEIPYADPHTAAPALWAYQYETHHHLEVSFAVITGGVQVRRMYEATVISQLRKQHQKSPLASFGRMPNGWVKSSANNGRLVAAGKRFHGFKDDSATRSKSQICILDENQQSLHLNWAGLQWSKWSDQIPMNSVKGLYRISATQPQELIYIGEGKIRDRLSAHKKKSAIIGHRQSTLFSGLLNFSWVETSDLDSTQRQEWENDLIASHAITTGTFPRAQFIG
jgi:hypothetical protein